MTRSFGQLEAEDRRAWACIARDPDRAVVEHPSATLAQLVLRPPLLALAVLVNQRNPDRDVGREELLGDGAEGVRPDPLVAQEDAGIARTPDRELLVEDPALEPQRPLGTWPEDRGLLGAL